MKSSLEPPFLIVGMARSGVAAALALARAVPDAAVVGCDLGRPAEVEESAKQLAAKGVHVELESTGLDLLDQFQPRTAIKSPGVPLNAAAVGEARKRGIEVIGELELAWRLLDNPFIAVTGTNGKTTTTALIGAIFAAAGRPFEVVGNIGRPVSSLVGSIASGATVICEVSSFQSEDSPTFTPQVAAFLNFSPDHGDRYDSVDDYLSAKLALFVKQGSDDFAVLNTALPLDESNLPGNAEHVWFSVDSGQQTRQIAATVDRGWISWRGDKIVEVSSLTIRGQHNLENALAATAIAKCMGIDSRSVASGLKSFTGIPHRMEEIAVIDEVTYINDSKATNVAAAAVAIESFEALHLIAGGSLKGGDFKALIDPIARHCSRCYLIGEAAEQLKHDLAGTGVETKISGTLERALNDAAAHAIDGDVVLLAPACASFDQFSNFEDRGDRYRVLVEGLKSGG